LEIVHIKKKIGKLTGKPRTSRENKKKPQKSEPFIN
jgi:hypothetical protein